MNEIFIVTSSLFFLWIIREIFFWITLWQENEYRQDRLFESLQKKIRKQTFLSTGFFILKWIIFFGYGFVVFNDDLSTIYSYIIVGLYILQAFLLLREIYLNHLKKPTLTLRAIIILILSFITILGIFALPLMDRFFWLLFIDLFVPTIVTLFVLLFIFPTEIYADWQVEKAGRKIREYPNLLVIAVTGSVGKSMTKDYLATLLSQKFIVVKTTGKDNTASGIARTILKKVNAHTEIFVAEISAYHQGEIALLSQLIKAKIGVLTAINSNHITLFKNLETIKKTNFELVESLPKQGFCLFAGDNKNTLGLYKKSKKPKILYRTARKVALDPSGKHSITAFSAATKKNKTAWKIHFEEKELQLFIPAFVHIDRLLPAIYIAASLGMSEAQIKKAIARLK